jgi:hypothetical protein
MTDKINIKNNRQDQSHTNHKKSKAKNEELSNLLIIVVIKSGLMTPTPCFWYCYVSKIKQGMRRSENLMNQMIL